MTERTVRGEDDDATGDEVGGAGVDRSIVDDLGRSEVPISNGAPRPAFWASPATAASLGLHILVDLHGCAGDPVLLARAPALRALVERLVDASGMTRLGSTFHQFEPAGATGCVLLAESHVALHTWPEAGFVSLDVYVCNHGRDNCAAGRRLADALVAALAPTSVQRREVVRDRVA